MKITTIQFELNIQEGLELLQPHFTRIPQPKDSWALAHESALRKWHQYASTNLKLVQSDKVLGLEVDNGVHMYVWPKDEAFAFWTFEFVEFDEFIWCRDERMWHAETILGILSRATSRQPYIPAPRSPRNFHPPSRRGTQRGPVRVGNRIFRLPGPPEIFPVVSSGNYEVRGEIPHPYRKEPVT